MSERISGTNYPLKHQAAQMQAASGRRVTDVNLDALAAGDLSLDDLQIHADTLRAQAAIAAQAGYTQLAANLTRAAELTAVPNDEILKMYDLLRPERASFEKLQELADYLQETYGAVENARLVREAADVYRERGLLKR